MGLQSLTNQRPLRLTSQILASTNSEMPSKGRPRSDGVVPLLRSERGGSGAAAQGVSGCQSACLRRNAGISTSSMPPDASALTRSEAWVRLVRQTLGTLVLAVP